MTGAIRNVFPENGLDILRNLSRVVSSVGLLIAFTLMANPAFSQEKKRIHSRWNPRGRT
jgi:hypothetical protein